MKGIYSTASMLIREDRLRRKGKIIAANNIARRLDLSDVSREELEQMAADAITRVALYQNDYRSVIKGEGFFANIDDCKNPVFFQNLLENAEDETIKKAVVEGQLSGYMKGLIKKLPDYEQYSFQFDSNGHSKIISELTKDQILEMLQKEAKSA